MNLGQKPNLNDPVLQFMAKVLTLDYLPGERITSGNDRGALYTSLLPRSHSLKIELKKEEKTDDEGSSDTE